MVEKPGKVHQSPGDVRLSYQPGLRNGFIWRKSGVNRKSEKVIAQGENFADRMRGKSIATECKGKPRAQFFSCLRTAGKRAYGSR